MSSVDRRGMLGAVVEFALLFVVVVVVVVAAAFFALARTERGSSAQRAAYAAIAETTGLRYKYESERGPTLRGHRAGVELTVCLTKLNGRLFHCATAVTARKLPSFVAHHRAFPFPSTATRGATRVDTGDEAFEKKYEAYGSLALPVDVRNALLSMRCAELTVLLQRVSVVWPAATELPTADEIDAARTAVEALARADEGDAYR